MNEVPLWLGRGAAGRVYQLSPEPPGVSQYRGISLTEKRTPLGPYRRPVPKGLGGS